MNAEQQISSVSVPVLLSSECKDPPNFGSVDMVWEERESGRPGDEVTLDCPTDFRNGNDVNSTTIIVRCTSEGWTPINKCMKSELHGWCKPGQGRLAQQLNFLLFIIFTKVKTGRRLLRKLEYSLQSPNKQMKAEILILLRLLQVCDASIKLTLLHPGQYLFSVFESMLTYHITMSSPLYMT